MAYRVVFAPEATAQLVSIYNYIAEAAGPGWAFAFVASIIDHCESFTRFPHRGTRRDDLRPGLRTIGFLNRIERVWGSAAEQRRKKIYLERIPRRP